MAPSLGWGAGPGSAGIYCTSLWDSITLASPAQVLIQQTCIPQNWGQLTPEYTKLSFFFPINGFLLREMKMPGFIGLKVWREVEGARDIIFRRGLGTPDINPRRRSGIVASKLWEEKEKSEQPLLWRTQSCSETRRCAVVSSVCWLEVTGNMHRSALCDPATPCCWAFHVA